jgi:hypothetical protein
MSQYGLMTDVNTIEVANAEYSAPRWIVVSQWVS